MAKKCAGDEVDEICPRKYSSQIQIYLRVLAKDFTLCYLSLKSTIMENSRHCINKLRFCFTIDESYQVEIFRKIMRCQGYFFQIALETRLISHIKRHSWQKGVVRTQWFPPPGHSPVPGNVPQVLSGFK